MKRSALTLAALAFLLAASAGAEPSAKRTKGVATATTSANAYFVPDENDPYTLHPSPDFKGFDAGYVKLMARPHPADLDADAAAKPPVMLQAPTDLPAPNPFADTASSVLVLQGDPSWFNAQTGEFDTQNGLFQAANAALGQLGDFYDFIAVFTTVQSQSVAAFYLPLKNDIQGLGDCNTNTGETFGCQFNQLQGSGINNLQGLLFMNAVSYWQDWDSQVDGEVHPFDSFDASIFAVLGQETAHRWGSGLRFVDPRNHNVSKKLLGRDNSHWAAFVDTNASVMDGWDWGTPENGRFKLLNDMDIYSTLDLYAMGALPVAAANPFFFIDNATYDVKGPQANALGNLQGKPIGPADVLELGLPSVSFMTKNGIDMGAKGTEVDLTIQDIVNAEGNRCPDPDHTQRAYRQAIVLVTKPGESPAQVQPEVDQLNTITATWQKWWASRTGNALTLCTVQSQDPNACQQPLMTLGGGDLDTKGGHSFIERGETVTLHMAASALATYPVPTGTATGGTVKNAHLSLSLDSEGSHHASLPAEDISVGDIKPGQVIDVPVKVAVDAQYNCGDSLTVVGTLHADNAPDVTEVYRLFPGEETTFFESFGNPGDKFQVNADGGDGQKGKGALKREDVELSCDITPRTPETDNTPGSKGAYVTSGDLSRSTSLWSPAMDLSQTADPEIAFDLWLQGDQGDSMAFELSKDGKNFVSAANITDAAHHKWLLQRINIKQVLGEVPPAVTARWTFKGNGHLEGGVDNVRVIDSQGQCRQILSGFCGCTTDGGAAPQSTLAVVLGLLGLRVLRRRVK